MARNKTKVNYKETINIIELVDSFIKHLNIASKEAKIDKVYDISIIDTKTVPSLAEVQRGIEPKKRKQLKLTIADTETRERETIYTLDYVAKNPADLLTAPYKRNLYRQFLYEATGNLIINLANQVEQERIKNHIEHATLTVNK